MSNDVHSVIVALIEKAAKNNDKEAALKACKSIRMLGVTLLVPAGKTLPGLVSSGSSASSDSKPSVPAGSRTLTSKYDGKCLHCGESYREGDAVMWVPADTSSTGKSQTYHPECVR
jgi:hypothetical protein